MTAVGYNYFVIFLCSLYSQFICVNAVFGNDGIPCKREKAAMDRAWLTVVPAVGDLNPGEFAKFELLAQTDACYKCDTVYVATIQNNENCTVQLPTMFPVTLEIREIQPGPVPGHVWRNESLSISEHSDYVIMVTQPGDKLEHPSYEYQYYCENDAMDSNIPIYVALGILFAAAIAWVIIRKFGLTDDRFHKVKTYFVPYETLVQSDLGQTQLSEGESLPKPVSLITPEVEDKKAKRLRSLDAFRGICLCIMIFVNYGGGGYWFFDHSYWNGLTVADLVFPWFTWIIGTAIALSLKNLRAKGFTQWALVRKIIIRTIILFCLGIILESSDGSESVSLSHLRIPGVLQRLAVSYGVVALIQIVFADDYIQNPHRLKWFSEVRDILPYWPEWLFYLTLVAIHLLLTYMIHVPTCPKGYVGPGGLANHGKHVNCTGGAASYIDRWLFGEEHIYQTPTCKEIYQTTVPHDPEGFLGTLTSIFICFLGLQAGKIILLYDDWVKRIVRFCAWGFALCLLAGCLCRFSQNEGWVPVNKNLWSVSFVLCLGGMAFLLFTACYITIDVFHIWSGAPFKYPGMNSIFVYVCHIVFGHYFPVSWNVQKEHASLLALHLWGVCFWTIISAVLYYKKIFIAI